MCIILFSFFFFFCLVENAFRPIRSISFFFFFWAHHYWFANCKEVITYLIEKAQSFPFPCTLPVRPSLKFQTGTVFWPFKLDPFLFPFSFPPDSWTGPQIFRTLMSVPQKAQTYNHIFPPKLVKFLNNDHLLVKDGYI